MVVVHSLRLLGFPRLDSPQGFIQLPAKQLGILALLAYQAPRPVARDYLAELLWPKGGPTARNHSLSQALYNIRRRSGGAFLHSFESILQLRDLDCDLWELRDAMKAGSYEEAAERLTAEFCEGYVLKGCVEFDQWLESARSATRELAFQLMDEPLPSDLRNSLASTVSLPSEDNRSPRISTADPTNEVRASFVGRIKERRELENAWNSSREGRIATSLVTGEPGIGKTSLCERVLRKAVLQGARSLTAEGYEVQSNLAYGIVSQLLRDAHRSGLVDHVEPSWRAVVSSFLPAADPHVASAAPADIPDQYQSYRIAGGIHHLLRESALRNPLVIFVDDVQWADAMSMSILHYVAHCDPELPIYILLAARDSELPFLGEGKWSLTNSVTLGGLSHSESRRLFESIGPASSSLIDSDSLQQLAGGNPFLIKALGKRSAAPEAGLPPTVKDYFRNELAHLPDHVRLTGASIASVKDPLSSSEIAWLAGLPETLADVSVGHLLTAGFVEAHETSGLFDLKHQLLRELFLGSIPPVESAKLHGRAARFLRDRGSPIAIVATQMMVAGNDADTCETALEAARASVRLHAHREAEHFYRIAIGTAPSEGIELKTRIALSTIYLQQGRSEEAVSLLTAISQNDGFTPEECALLEAHILIAKLAEAGPPSLPHAAYNRAGDLEELLPPGLVTKLYVDIAANAQHGLHVLFGKATKAALRSLHKMDSSPDQTQLEVLISAFLTVNAFTAAKLERLDELTNKSSRWPATFATCLSAGALVRFSRGLARDAERLFLQALQVCEQYGFLDQRLRVLNNLGVCFMEQGRWADAQQQFDAVARAGGSVAPKEIPSALNNLLIIEYERGRFSETLDLGRKYLAETALRTRLRIGSLGVLGLAELQCGRLSKAREYENAIRTNSSFDVGWSNDVSYIEIFIARMSSINGQKDEAEVRLKDKVELFWPRDFYCAARMKVELLRHVAARSPEAAVDIAKKLRPTLAAANAVPLVERLDRIIRRYDSLSYPSPR